MGSHYGRSLANLGLMCRAGPTRELRNPSLSFLVNHVLDGALVGNGHGLLRDGTAAVVEAFGLVHGTLERITLPAEHVISVGAVPTALKAPHKRVRSAGSP